ADRDFVAEFLFVAALTGVHLSRLGEEVVLWTTPAFGWVQLDDAFATGSSILPQKKNPDIAQLAPRQSGRLAGAPPRGVTVLQWRTTVISRRTRSRSSTPWTRWSWYCPRWPA